MIYSLNQIHKDWLFNESVRKTHKLNQFNELVTESTSQTNYSYDPIPVMNWLKRLTSWISQMNYSLTQIHQKMIT